MKKYLLIVLLFGSSGLQAQQVCAVGCFLVQGPQYQYGDMTFGQWDPDSCCL